MQTGRAPISVAELAARDFKMHINSNAELPEFVSWTLLPNNDRVQFWSHSALAKHQG